MCRRHSFRCREQKRGFGGVTGHSVSEVIDALIHIWLTTTWQHYWEVVETRWVVALESCVLALAPLSSPSLLI